MLTQYGMQLDVSQEPGLPGGTVDEWTWSPCEQQLVSAGSPSEVTPLTDVSVSLGNESTISDYSKA